MWETIEQMSQVLQQIIWGVEGEKRRVAFDPDYIKFLKL